MELYWKHVDTGSYNEGTGLDLDDVWAEPDVFDEETFKLAILFHIALWAKDSDYSNLTLDRVVGFTLDNDGDEVEIKSEMGDWTWLDNVVDLYVYLQAKPYLEANMFLACIKNEDWDSFNWDNLDHVEDTFHREWDGDYEEFAREWMDDVGEDLPEHLAHHFDYDAYGRDLIESYDRVEFANEEYLFHQ